MSYKHLKGEIKMNLGKFTKREIKICEGICKENNLKFVGITRINEYSHGIYFKALKGKELLNILYSSKYDFVSIQ
jgi:hypothetical protein